MEMAGIEMLPPEAGVAWIRRELTSSAESGEVVVAGRLGVLTEERDPTGGLDPAAVAGPAGTGPMVGAVQGAGVHSGLVVRTELDPTRQPFLDHHRIDGTAVLPGVMGAEAFAEVATLLAPGYRVAAVEDLDFLAPVKFYRDEPRTLTIGAVVHRDGPDLLADCRLQGERLLPGSDAPQVTTHFTGRVRLTRVAPEPERDDTPLKEAERAVAAADVYRVYFHGPAYQVVEQAWRYDGGCVGRLAAGLPPDHLPATAPTLIGPRLVELCFQTAGLWQAGREGVLGLPLHVDAVRLLADPATAAAGGLYAVVQPRDQRYDCAVVDERGTVVVSVEGYRTIALPGRLGDDARAPVAGAMAD
jgi:hypothetical protein